MFLIRTGPAFKLRAKFKAGMMDDKHKVAFPLGMFEDVLRETGCHVPTYQ